MGSASSAALACHQVSARTAGNLCLVVARQLTPEHRASLDRCAQHPWLLDVDGEDLTAVELGRRVEPLDWLAGDFPLPGILELNALGIGRAQFGRGSGNLAIGGRALGRRMSNDAFADAQLANRHF